MPTLKYPKWMYRKDPAEGAFQSTLVANDAVAGELAADGWNDDPHSHGIDVVPYPAELTPAGTLMHHPTRPDANGNHAHGPAPTAVGISGSLVLPPDVTKALAELVAARAELAALKAGKAG